MLDNIQPFYFLIVNSKVQDHRHAKLGLLVLGLSWKINVCFITFDELLFKSTVLSFPSMF